MWTGCGCRSMTTGSDRVGVDSVRAGSRPSSPQPRLCDDGPITMAVYTLNSTDCVRVCTDICWYREELSNESRTVSEACISRATHPPLPRLDTWALSRCLLHTIAAASRCRHACVAGRTWPIGLGARMWTSGGQFDGLLIIKDHVSQPWAASGARERRLSLQDHHTRGWRCCGYSGKACSKVPDGPVVSS